MADAKGRMDWCQLGVRRGDMVTIVGSCVGIEDIVLRFQVVLLVRSCARSGDICGYGRMVTAHAKIGLVGRCAWWWHGDHGW